MQGQIECVGGPVPTIHNIKCFCVRCKEVCDGKTLHEHFMHPYCHSCSKMLQTILRSQ